MRKAVVSAILMTCMVQSAAWGSGLAIPEQGTAAMAMSAAVTARSEDLSAIFYNPAGIDYVDDTEVFVGLTPIRPGHTFTGTGESIDAEGQFFFPPQLYAAKRFTDGIVAGLGVYAPFGLGTDWGQTWDGRYTSTEASIQTVYVNPTISLVMNRYVTVGLGASYVYSNANIEKMVDTGLALYSAVAASGSNPAQFEGGIANIKYDSEFKLDGTGSGFGYTLGAIIRPMQGFQFGISYRGATDIDYEGDATFAHKELLKGIPLSTTMTAYDAIVARMPLKQDGKATLHLPWMLNLGAMYDLTYDWDVSADLDFVGWSVYDELTIDYAKNLPYDKVIQPKDWENSWVARVGTSYDITDFLTGRAGLLYDTTPVPDATFDGQLPDNDRVGLSIGAGYRYGVITFDVSYMYLSFSDRTKNNLVGYADVDSPPDGIGANDKAMLDGALDAHDRGVYPVGSGKYKSNAHLFSVSASYRF